MMTDIYLVTIANSAYFELARELIASVRATSSCIVNIGVLDVGLTAAEINSFRDDGVTVVAAEWEFPGAAPHGMQRTFLAMLSRPFIPKYFPGNYTYVYLDADCWVQHRDAVLELADACLHADVAAVPELHAAYPHLYSPASVTRSMHREAFSLVYGAQFAPADSVIINSGVFAARSQSPLWQAWQTILAEAVASHMPDAASSNGRHVNLTTPHPAMHFIEQNALNVAAYRGDIRVQVMSALYNWICTLAMPLFNPASGLLVEPAPPYDTIRIVHLTLLGREASQILDRHGMAHTRSLRWQSP